MNSKYSRILSGINTSGSLHIGNYLGAIRNWVNIQHEANEIYLFLADLHAITVDQDPEHLRKSIIDIAITYIACGIDPTKCNIFSQACVHTHAELSWLLSCVARIGWLNRMTQFKDKSGKNKEQAYLGLYSYPVLMAADILLYHPSHVPVGDDQKQHVELTRDIAQAFNHKYNIEYFKLPEYLTFGEATRIMSLRDGTKKMSKSDISDNSRINLYDTPELIKQKILRAKTDSELISLDNLDNRPELKNLATMYAAFSNTSRNKVIEQYSGKGYKEFKENLADIIIENISPISKEIHRLRNDHTDIINILKKGNERALEKTIPTLQEIKEIMGFVLL